MIGVVRATATLKKLAEIAKCFTFAVSAIVQYNANVRLIKACKNILISLLEEDYRGLELTIFN